MVYAVHGILQARILEWVSLSLLQGIFSTQGLNPGIEPGSLSLQADSLPTELSGKPTDTNGVYIQLIFNKGAKVIKLRIVFLTSGAETTGCPGAKK